MKTVIVTGSRDWNNKYLLEAAIASEKPDLVVQGGARGADFMAASWASGNGVESATVPAMWHLYGNRAGMIRNSKMLNTYNKEEYGDVVVLAFRLDNSRGTTDTINKAKELNIEVKVFDEVST